MSIVHKLIRNPFQACVRKAVKHSPELLTGAGVVGIVATVVLASKSSMKLPAVIKEFQFNRSAIEEHDELRKFADDSEKTRAVIENYVGTAKSIIKLYGPAVVLGVASISCFISSNRILRARNIALAGAYKALDAAYTKYRNRVIEEFGEEKDLEYRLDYREEVVENEVNGQKVKTTVRTIDPIGPYAKFFDETNQLWDKNRENNLFFITRVQQQMNDRLQARGHVFLNEVYDALGLLRTPMGQIAGWLRDTEDGDGYIDFRIHDINDQQKRDFVNGYEPAILLDFNVEGIIYELI